MFAGSTKVETVPSGSLSNAALVGANTVNGPSLFKVSANPAALTAVTKVLKSSFPIAISAIVSCSGMVASVETSVVSIAISSSVIVSSEVFFSLSLQEVNATEAITAILNTNFFIVQFF